MLSHLHLELLRLVRARPLASVAVGGGRTQFVTHLPAARASRPATTGIREALGVLPARTLRKLFMTVIHAIMIWPIPGQESGSYTFRVIPRWAQTIRKSCV